MDQPALQPTPALHIRCGWNEHGQLMIAGIDVEAMPGTWDGAHAVLCRALEIVKDKCKAQAQHGTPLVQPYFVIPGEQG